MDMMGMGTLMNVGANFSNLVASVNNSCSQSPIKAEGNTFKFDQDSLQEAIEGMRQKLEALGVEVPESSYAQGQLIDMQGMQEAMQRLSVYEQQQTKIAQIEQQYAADKYEMARSEFFSEHHYEFDANGNPVRLVDGPEDAESARMRTAWEKRAAYEYDLAQASKEPDYSGMPASAKLNDLMSDQEKMQEFFSDSEKAKELQQLQIDAQREAQIAEVKAQADRMRMLNPFNPEMQGEVNKYQSTSISALETAWNNVDSCEAKGEIDAYTAQMEEQMAKMRAQLEEKMKGMSEWDMGEYEMTYTV